jgi:hypothetical protein
MNFRWSKLGGQMGIIFCLAGLVLVWAGWNGAASYDRIQTQFPYLISGGVAGLCLVIIGVGLFIVQSQRQDRVQLEANLVELRRLIEAQTGVPTITDAGHDADVVVAGPNAYHLPNCKLVEGRQDLKPMPVAQARAAGLNPCRTCNPPAAEVVVEPEPAARSGAGR